MATTRLRLALGVTALLAFIAEIMFLGGTLEWVDAYVGAAVQPMLTETTLIMMKAVSNAEPFVGVAIVLAGLVLAVRGRMEVRSVAAILAQLAVGLVLVWLFKELFERTRPGALPWDAGDSFPSGHVANGLLCLGAAVRLVPRRGGRVASGVPRALVLVGGLVYVLGVACARILLARHWMTDVTASFLLGTFLMALAPQLWPTTTRALVLATPVVILCACVSVATGGRIRLPSPSTLSSGPFAARDAGDKFLATIELDDDSVLSVGGGRRLTLLSPTYGKQWVNVGDGRRPIVKLLARRRRALTDVSHRVTLLVDGTVVGSEQLESRWRSLVFALPVLEPGPHEIELLTPPRESRSSIVRGEAFEPAGRELDSPRAR
jgi:membrane-associated phospholipid phosphatase